MSDFWFDKLGHIVPNHLTGVAPETVVAPDEVEQVTGRAMLAKRLKPIPIEAVVRGYLAGSGWKEYTKSGTVCGIALPPGLAMTQPLVEPIFTPATKAAVGDHDENITYAQVVEMIGASLAEKIRTVSIALYETARDVAAKKGIIIADTKFEFGLDPNGNLVLMDEVLTPDSSRYWPADQYKEGVNPPSYDKQFLRDWLESAQVQGKPWSKSPPAPHLPAEVIAQTAAKYQEAWERLKDGVSSTPCSACVDSATPTRLAGLLARPLCR